MKTKKISLFIAAIVLLFSITFMGCSKDKATPTPITSTTTTTTTPPPTLCSNNLTGSINGNPYTATFHNNQAVSGTIAVGTSNITNDAVQLNLWIGITPGTYNMVGTVGTDGSLGPIEVGATLGDLTVNPPIQYVATSGGITITSHDVAAKNIVGTFSFQAIDGVSGGTSSITNASFCVNY